MKRHIVVTEYSVEWPLQFNSESEKIEKILGTNCVIIHHIGSTAVPNLKAKPTIDIMPIVNRIADVDLLKEKFEQIGYEYLSEYGICGRRYLRKIEGESDLYHIHIFEESNTKDITRHLAVRDYLRTHREVAIAYGNLKEKLAQEFPYDNNGYCDGKDAFVKQMEKEAMLDIF